MKIQWSALKEKIKMHKLATWPQYSEEEKKAVQRVLSSGRVNYWTGEEGKKFESEFSSWCGAKYSIAVANGTVALDLALRGLGISEGDEVIVTPRSFIASVSSVINVGATPVFADVDLDSGNLNASTIRKNISKQTKAIICVHLGGLPCEMDEIIKLARESDIYIIEDCAQAHGAVYKKQSVGTLGDAAAWSFCQDKIMTTGGEGGMVTTNNKSLSAKMQSYKDHGKNFSKISKPQNKFGFRWIHDSFGTNFRMTEMQSAIGRVQLTKIKDWNKKRRENAQRLFNAFSDFEDLIEVPKIPDHVNHAFYRVYVNVNENVLKKSWDRNRILEEINLKGVPCFSGSCPEIYREKAFDLTTYAPESRLNNAKLLGEISLAFLCHPNLLDNDLEYTETVIRRILSKSTKRN